MGHFGRYMRATKSPKYEPKRKMNGKLGIMQIMLMKVIQIILFLKTHGNQGGKTMEVGLVNLLSKDVLILVVIQIMNLFR